MWEYLHLTSLNPCPLPPSPVVTPLSSFSHSFNPKLSLYLHFTRPPNFHFSPSRVFFFLKSTRPPSADRQANSRQTTDSNVTSCISYVLVHTAQVSLNSMESTRSSVIKDHIFHFCVRTPLPFDITRLLLHTLQRPAGFYCEAAAGESGFNGGQGPQSGNRCPKNQQ